MKKEFSILIGGAAGEGTRLSGQLIGKLLNQYGWRIFIYEDYQSLITGGHNFSVIRACGERISAPTKKIDYLIALNQDTLDQHKADLKEEGLIIYNSDGVKNYPQGHNSGQIKSEKGIAIAANTITAQLGGKPIMKNSSLFGALVKVLGIDWKFLEDLLKKEFGEKAELNLKIAKAGYDLAQTHQKIERLNQKPQPLITGNEAVALGALKAGLEVYISYPMTPASSILHYLAGVKKDLNNIVVFQPENEIEVINAAIGSAYAGKRSMVGSSGGGFALMVEALSLSAQSETPVVVVESQRPGPATGLPTYTAQGDLLFVLSAGHGDFKRFVVAPGDAEEAFYLTGLAMHMAWRYQMPAIVLIDKEISEDTFNLDEAVLDKVKIEKAKLWDKKGDYKRYLDTEDGVSPLAFPGEKGITIKGTSYEHDESGITIEESESDIKKMQEKRLRKYEGLEKEIKKFVAVKVFGNKNSDKAIIVFGSTKGVAIELGEELGIKVIQVLFFQPFPEEEMKEATKGVQKIISIETNATAQLAQVLRCHGVKVDDSMLKYTGRPFFVEELREILKSKI
jgi:2-oxoglutarate ferredoxin oxidoreductase subunit alpha